MPGRRKEPINLIKLKGKSHFTKAQIEEREKTTVSVEPKGLYIPEELNEEQAMLYAETYEFLSEYDLATHLETDLLVRFVRARFEYDRITKSLESNVEMDDLYYKALNARLKVSDELRKCENDLGLNVFSRMKMAVPKKEEKAETEAERLFGEL